MDMVIYFFFYTALKNKNEAGLEIAGHQWPKASHILEIAGENKTGPPIKKKMASEIQLISLMSVYFI